MKITIIGAGPIGCYAGYLLAKSGHDVSIFDRKKEIGTPIQCTGILTSDFDQFDIPIDSFLVNTINQIEAYSPNEEKVTIKQKDYIVCRKRFDNYLANMAVGAGAKIFLQHSFSRKEEENIVIKDSVNEKEVHLNSDIVIAADGPLSPTAKAYGFYHDSRENYYGIQAIVEGKFESNITKTYFGNDVCPGFFVWVVPESSTKARVGLYATKNQKYYFDKFMEKQDFRVLEMQAGTIPIFHSGQKLKKDNCYLIGDASSYVKATTGGGLVPGMKQVEILVDCIDNGKDFDKEVGSLRKKMRLHLQVSKVMGKFSDHDWNKLVSYVGQPKVQSVFEKYTRDNPVPLLLGTLFKEPKFLRFVKYLF